MFVGFTALSVEIRTKRLQPFREARCGTMHNAAFRRFWPAAPTSDYPPCHIRRRTGYSVPEPHLGQPLRLLRKCGQSAVREELFPLVPVVRDTVRQHPDIQEGADTAAAVIDVLCHMCDVVEIEQLVRHFQPVCPTAVRNCGIPHCRQHLRRLIDPVILNEVPVQLDMLSVWGIDLDVMVRDLPDPVRKVLRKRLHCPVQICLTDKYVDIAACPHPRLGIVPAEHRAFQGNKGDPSLFKRFADFFQLMLELLTAEGRTEHFVVKLLALLAAKTVVFQTERKQVREVMPPRKRTHGGQHIRGIARTLLRGKRTSADRRSDDKKETLTLSVVQTLVLPLFVEAAPPPYRTAGLPQVLVPLFVQQLAVEGVSMFAGCLNDVVEAPEGLAHVGEASARTGVNGVKVGKTAKHNTLLFVLVPRFGAGQTEFGPARSGEMDMRARL